MTSSNIPTEYVDKFYVMDPKTEDIFVSGLSLKEGMVVLLEDSMLRASLKEDDHEGIENYEQNRRDECNRWCEVTQLKPGSVVRFVGVYADGTKRVRQFSEAFGWIVKLESLPQPMRFDAALEEAITNAHITAVQVADTYHNKAQMAIRLFGKDAAKWPEEVHLALEGREDQPVDRSNNDGQPYPGELEGFVPYVDDPEKSQYQNLIGATNAYYGPDADRWPDHVHSGLEGRD